jgi:hypothetical protein
VKNGGLLRERSSTAAKEEVSTTLSICDFEAAERMERTPFRAGIINSFSLSVVLYVSGYYCEFLSFGRKGRKYGSNVDNGIDALYCVVEYSGLLEIADEDEV